MKASILFLCYIFSLCRADLDTEWWKHTIIYAIVPFSFKDSDGDGIGDLKGITSKLDYIEGLGIETIQLTPIYETPFKDIGYDITDYYKIDKMYGTMDDFDELVSELKKRDMKLIMDMVINHSGDQHEWFQKSIDRIDPYTDFYVWKDSKGFNNETGQEIPPNKWFSLFSPTYEAGTAWEWNEKRKQFYLHQFLPEQVDFNLNNPVLKSELKKMIEFWLDKGVAGFRFDATPYFFENKDFRDAVYYYDQVNQPETLEFLHELRLSLDEYNKEHGGIERIFIAEAHILDSEVVKYFGKKDYPIMHFPYSFNFEYLEGHINPFLFEMYTNYYIESLPKNAVTAWMSQDHDVNRIGSRMTPEYSDIITIASMLLPGTAGCYYGQEIGMLNGLVRQDQFKDFSDHGARDPARLIMQWDDSMNAGFTNNSVPFLPPNSDYFERNVESQQHQENTHLSLFKDLSVMRKTNTLKFGNYKTYYSPYSDSEFIHVMTRSHEDRMVIVVTNFSVFSSSRFNMSRIIQNLPKRIVLATSSINSGYAKGSVLGNEIPMEFMMRPLSCLVFEA
ncbi:maltase A1-like [Planococcus citri]|uniref:maltase A1-like n=1 Tax=Planococcus citri TaxID=170843 RepID=UPI0031F80355